MDTNTQGLSLDEAREIDLIKYLSSLGHEPVKIRNADYWYLSPLRNEVTASFKVNTNINRWYDHGIGQGGNTIDFALIYHKCTVGEFMEQLNGNLILQKPTIHQPGNTITTEHKIKVVEDSKLESYALLKYLEERKIPLEIAVKFCSEVKYELSDKIYYGIGFKNDSGGYEIRNPYFKSGSSPKGITTINNSADTVCVFEGFIDFMSFLATNKNLPEKSQDFVVLNSVSFFERARSFMENHESIRLYLDRDATGRNNTQRALSLSTKYNDQSHLYEKHKDFNDWLTNNSKPQKKHRGQRL
ncbi:DNA primase [Flavobacterium zepuense]|uniref:DNA primase n=1 Tax=Flavobacterium zepuense TaxID=2593302 RepID=A0A552V4K5_9FLAO|nr:toprim domain-containing protein [Flavobacterium zepuense]TRW25372.1 DNA primase [Flavobacterium zepuense]